MMVLRIVHRRANPLELLLHEPLRDVADHLAHDALAQTLEHAPRHFFDDVIVDRGR